MTRAEWLQRKLLMFPVTSLDGAIELADALEKTGAAPWDDAVVIGPIDGMMSFTLAQRTVEAAVAMEREACAKIADTGACCEDPGLAALARAIASDIRARG